MNLSQIIQSVINGGPEIGKPAVRYRTARQLSYIQESTKVTYCPQLDDHQTFTYWSLKVMARHQVTC